MSQQVTGWNSTEQDLYPLEARRKYELIIENGRSSTIIVKRRGEMIWTPAKARGQTCGEQRTSSSCWSFSADDRIAEAAGRKASNENSGDYEPLGSQEPDSAYESQHALEINVAYNIDIVQDERLFRTVGTFENQERRHEVGRKLRRYNRRWIVERTNAWLGQFRRLLVRHEHLLSTYYAFFYLACFWITLRRYF